MTSQNKNIIYPVILKVPEEKRAFSGRESAGFLSQYAREAVVLSAKKTGMDLAVFEKGSDGVPLPSNGIFWSLSHKPKYVVGVMSETPIGIDIERIRPVQASLVNRIIDNVERQLAGTISDALFFRFWTAKESVLKAAGVGLKGLSQCKINRIIDETHLIVFYDQKYWMVEHAHYDNHLVSVVIKDQKVRWCESVTG